MKVPDWVVDRIRGKVPERFTGEIRINCFVTDPSIKSSLTFLRKTTWAREKVEGLYLETISRDD